MSGSSSFFQPSGEAYAEGYFTPAQGFPRTIDAKLREVQVSVTDFLLSGETDLGLALRRARNLGALDPYRVLFVPSGNWTVASWDPTSSGYAFAMSGLSNCWLRGEHRDTTIITCAPGTDMGMLSLTNLSRVTISDMTFDAARASQTIPNPTRPNKHLIRAVGLNDVVLARLRLLNAQAYGLGCQSGEFVDVLFDDIEVVGCGTDGIDIKNTLASNRNILVRRPDITDHGRASPTVAKAGLDVRGPVRVENGIARLTTSVGTATNHALFRARPDDSGAITYDGANILPVEGDIVTGVSSLATAEVSALSGSSVLATGGIGLRDIVGVFTANEALTLSGGKTATCRTFSPPIPNGGGGAVFDNCTAVGPADGVSGVGFVMLDEDVTLLGCRAERLRTGALIQSGGIRASVENLVSKTTEIGVDVRSPGARITGGSLGLATETAIDLVDANDAVVSGVSIWDSARGIRRNAAALNTRQTDMTFTNVPTPLSGFQRGDQRSTFPHVSLRAGATFAILPTSSYATSEALVGGAGGAANSTIYFFPIPLFDRASLLRLGTVIGEAVPGVSAKLALYRDIGETPGNDGTTISNLLGECSGALDMGATAGTQVRVNFLASFFRDPGIYWGAMKANGAAKPRTVPSTGELGEWARFVGVNNAAALFAGTGAQCRVSSTALVDYAAPFPAVCPAVTFATTSPGSPFIFAVEGAS